MSPLVEQIIQRLDLLPEQAQRQVLDVIDGLLEPQHTPLSAQGPNKINNENISHTVESDDMPNLENDGGIWLVKAGRLPLADYNDLIHQSREERIEKLMQW